MSTSAAPPSTASLASSAFADACPAPNGNPTTVHSSTEELPVVFVNDLNADAAWDRWQLFMHTLAKLFSEASLHKAVILSTVARGERHVWSIILATNAFGFSILPRAFLKDSTAGEGPGAVLKRSASEWFEAEK